MPDVAAGTAALLRSVRGISLDLDDTLWAVGPVIERAERRVLRWFAERHPAVGRGLTIERMHQIRAEVIAHYPERHHDLGFLRRASLARHVSDAGLPAAIADEAFAVFLAARNDVELYADVVPALEQLADRFPLIAVTNGNACLATIGLSARIGRCVSAGQFGQAKPHPGIFTAAAGELGLPVAALLHVGDDPQHDVVGARQAGCLTAWVNRRAARWPADTLQPHVVVSDLLQLVDLLAAA